LKIADNRESMKPSGLLVCLIASAIIPAAVQADQPAASTQASKSSNGSEMDKLAKALVGDWDTTETMERGEFFPSAGSRHGIVHVRLAAGGTTLIYEVHSNGSAGELDGVLLIWWDKAAKLYRIFVCFNNPNSPCKMRGTAHWEGEKFVNDYEETIGGKETRWRDTFEFAPTSHSLTAAVDAGNGMMTQVITTKATRR
jgi:hypothetical protein